MVVDEWLAANFTESAEAQKYAKAYAAKMGIDASTSQDIAQKVQVLFGRYKGVWAEIATKMQGTKGYPVKTSFTLAIGGPECKNPTAQQTQPGGGDSSDDTPPSATALAGAVAGKLGGLFHKKKDDAATSTAAAPGATPAAVPPGDVAVMTVSSQLISVSTNAVSPDAFTIPADYKRHDTKTE